VLFFVTGIIHSASGQVLMFDNFNYPAGESIIWHNWLTQQTNTTNAILVSNEGLSYTNYPCSGIGNGAAIGTTGQDVFRGFVKQTLSGSTIFMACLAKVTSGATGDAFISFKESPTSPTNLNYRGRVYAKVDASNNVSFGLSKGAITAPAVPNYSSAIYSLNTTYLLVVKYKINEGTTNDSAYLFINPVIGNPQPAPSVIATDISASDVGIGSVLLRQGTTGQAPTVIVDGVRVSKTWQQVLNVSNIATLGDLKVDGVTVSGFNPDITTYYDTVPAGQTSVLVEATPTDWAATTVITTASSIPGTSTVVVTAENGTTTKTYTVHHAYSFFTIDLTATPAAGGSVSGGGLYGQGFSATVTASPASGYNFVNWTEGSTVVSSNPVYTFPVSANRSLVANFVQVLQISAVADPIEGGSITGTGTVTYGSTATLTASSNTGYNFIEWSENGNPLGNNPVLVLTNITANHSVVAHFMLQTLSITTSANPTNGGTVTPSTTISYGSDFTINAYPNTGYIFENWTENGNILGTDPVLVLLNVTTDHNITGNFVESVNTFTVTASSNPPEGGSITGAGNVTLGGSITLTATANPNFIFIDWTENGNILGTDPQITLENVSANHILVATFLSNVGIPQEETGSLKIFPIPATDHIWIESATEINSLNIFNAAGIEISRNNSLSGKININTSTWPDGAYVFIIKTSAGTVSRKVLIN
jgi:hypothetical protein